jgi:hypothetical protein
MSNARQSQSPILEEKITKFVIAAAATGGPMGGGGTFDYNGIKVI